MVPFTFEMEQRELDRQRHAAPAVCDLLFLHFFSAVPLLFSAGGVFAALLSVIVRHHRRYVLPKFHLEMCLMVVITHKLSWYPGEICDVDS